MMQKKADTEKENRETIPDGKTCLPPCDKNRHVFKKMGKKLLVLIISLALALAVAEIILRNYVKHSRSLLFMDEKESSPALLDSLRYRPGEIVWESKCNSKGFFDDQEFVEAKTPGVKRVVALADSFGCAMIPCRYHAFTKAENMDGENPRWEIYNMSINGAGPEEYLYLLKNEALIYNPDLVLLGFYVGNDLSFSMNMIENISLKYKRKTERTWKPSEKIMLIKFCKRIYKLYGVYKMYKAGYLGEKAIKVFAEDPIAKHFVKNEKKDVLDTHANGPSGQDVIEIHSEQWWMNIENERPFLPEDEHITVQTNIFRLNLLSTGTYEYVGVTEMFKEMKELTGGEFAVVLFPDSSQIDDNIYKKILSNKKHPQYEQILQADRHAVYNNIKAILEEENIPFVDLLGPLQEGHKKYGRVYHYRDHHFNYWGNHVAGREIKTFLADYFAAEGDNRDKTR